MNYESDKAGFTLLELLLTISVLAVISAISISSYQGFTKGFELDSEAKTIISDLKSVRTRAMSGEDDMKWGIHFVNGTSDYYEIFETPTTYSDGAKVVKITNYLQSSITFSAPSEGNSTDVIFNKISGTASAATITISLQDNLKSVNVTTGGSIY